MAGTNVVKMNIELRINGKHPDVIKKELKEIVELMKIIEGKNGIK